MMNVLACASEYMVGLPVRSVRIIPLPIGYRTKCVYKLLIVTHHFVTKFIDNGEMCSPVADVQQMFFHTDGPLMLQYCNA